MSDALGGQTVTFGSWAEESAAEPDKLGIVDEAPTEVDVPGCLFRTLRADETPQTEVDINTQVWRCTAPITPATLNADSRGYLRYNDEVFQIVGGAQRFYDFAGRPHHVVILAQKQLA